MPSTRKNRRLTATKNFDPVARYLTVQGAAAYLSTTVWTIREIIAARKIPFGKVGKRFILDTHDLDLFFERQKVKAA